MYFFTVVVVVVVVVIGVSVSTCTKRLRDIMVNTWTEQVAAITKLVLFV
jgi:uncharacterized membrane protein YhaH (DUF805 family)